jgi:hypothetical protein
LSKTSPVPIFEEGRAMKTHVVAIETEPGALDVLPCQYVTLEKETFATHRTVGGAGWTISDIETGVYIAHGSTKSEVQHLAACRLRALNPGSLLRQWGLM